MFVKRDKEKKRHRQRERERERERWWESACKCACINSSLPISVCYAFAKLCCFKCVCMYANRGVNKVKIVVWVKFYILIEDPV